MTVYESCFGGCYEIIIKVLENIIKKQKELTDMKIKILELFGGISAPYRALLNLGIDVENVDYVEFDKKVVEIRNIMYNSNYEAKSVVDYSTNKEIDL
ncbi:hypothetical protein FQR65_LT20111 [Abscondita terminalis]|nr:hypothetical protein FQR65_LT20111 [Abscondita terminalis]